ncbi:hypothetical protein LCGC14_2910470 [marine sediment metagenome]|uniref:Uncharacterized protein n=1 Tax=marine sediment metagenome TaxID=412755 RepID=A0A0F8XRS0_9ZZZZ
MANISVSEKTFDIIASAAITCYLNDEHDEAEELDKIARRINAALSNDVCKGPWSKKGKGLKWRDVPSVLETVKNED